MFRARVESIIYLFFLFPVVRFIWSIFQCAYNTPARPAYKNV
jgi:hypothetical protein